MEEGVRRDELIIHNWPKLHSTFVVSWLQSRRGYIQCFLLIQLKFKHQGFKASAATYELNTSTHQKHEPRQQLWSGTGPMWSDAAWCGPARLISHTPRHDFPYGILAKLTLTDADCHISMCSVTLFVTYNVQKCNIT